MRLPVCLDLVLSHLAKEVLENGEEWVLLETLRSPVGLPSPDQTLPTILTLNCSLPLLCASMVSHGF